MFVVNVPYFNLDQIYNSLQAPRWIKLREMKYVVIHKEHVLKIEQQKQRLIFSCSEDEFYNIWFNYFDLRTDYLIENNKIKRLGGKFKIPANRGNGIHILNQDPFEMYIFCKLVSKVGFNKATELMNRIACNYGIEHKQSMREVGRIFWYEWPTPESLLEQLNKEKESSGKVKTFLKKLCNAIINDGFDITKSDNELFRLFGMHEINSFPLNGIEETLRKNFDCIPEEFADWYLDEIENKGLVYMYILHHITNPPKEIIRYGFS